MVVNIAAGSEAGVGKSSERSESTRTVAEDETAPRTEAEGERSDTKGIKGAAAIGAAKPTAASPRCPFIGLLYQEELVFVTTVGIRVFHHLGQQDVIRKLAGTVLCTRELHKTENIIIKYVNP
jgi:hypothetical protein